MLGKGLIKRLVAAAVVAGATFVAVVALGGTLYFLLTLMVVPAAAAGLTALIAALVAIGIALAFLGKASGHGHVEDNEPMGLGGRAYDLFRHRPVLGAVAALAGGWIFLRNPALATMVAAAFTEKSRRR